MGVISSLVAAGLIYLFRYNLGFLLNLIFCKLYPNISGEYKYYIYKNVVISESEAKKIKKQNKTKQNELLIEPGTKPNNKQLVAWLEKCKKNEQYTTMKLKQFANRISGEVYVSNKGAIKHIEKIYGKITPSRILVLNSENIDSEHHNFGTYLLNLTNDLNIIKGMRSGLCVNCGDATSDPIMLVKK